MQSAEQSGLTTMDFKNTLGVVEERLHVARLDGRRPQEGVVIA